MRIAGQHIDSICYEKKIVNKEEKPQDAINGDKNSTQQSKKRMSITPLSDVIEISQQSYLQKYFEEFNKSFPDGISSAIEKYKKLYEEIVKITPEGKPRDTRINLLDTAFEHSGAFHASAMSHRIASLSGVTLKVEMPELGTTTQKKSSYSEFDNIIEKSNKIYNEINNMFLNVKSYFKINGSFLGITDKAINSNFGTFSINDIDKLSKGLLQELQQCLEKSNSSYKDVSEKINQSNLSDYAKQTLNEVITKA